MVTVTLCSEYISTTLADWDSIGRVVTQTRGRVFQAIGRAFKLLLML